MPGLPECMSQQDMGSCKQSLAINEPTRCGHLTRKPVDSISPSWDLEDIRPRVDQTAWAMHSHVQLEGAKSKSYPQVVVKDQSSRLWVLLQKGPTWQGGVPHENVMAVE